MVRAALQSARRRGATRASFEFQMLYGIRTDLQRTLRDRGHPVRIYVPYGSHWYPYMMRRLAERPANLWFFLRNVLRRWGGGRAGTQGVRSTRFFAPLRKTRPAGFGS